MKRILTISCLVLLATASVLAQQVATDIWPNDTGYKLGTPTYRWDGFFQQLDVSGQLTINGQHITCNGADCSITGLKGDTGATGPAGPTGASGATPTVTIGVISTGIPGSQASCTNVGTSTNVILNCTFPAGTPGANGTGSGTVTSVAVGNLTPLFTAAVTSADSSPSVAFTLSTVATANKVFASPTSGGGAPSFRALVGSDLPVPAASTLGGVMSLAAVSNKFLTSIGTDGIPVAAQPSSSNLSDNANVAHYDAASPTFANGLTAASFTRADGKLPAPRLITFLAGSDTAAVVLADTDDQNDIFVNRLGQSVTIAEVYCKSDAGTPSIQIMNGANAVLGSALTCTTTGAASTTWNSTYNVVANGGNLNFQMVTAGGTAKRVTVVVKYQ